MSITLVRGLLVQTDTDEGVAFLGTETSTVTVADASPVASDRIVQDDIDADDDEYVGLRIRHAAAGHTGPQKFRNNVRRDPKRAPEKRQQSRQRRATRDMKYDGGIF